MKIGQQQQMHFHVLKREWNVYFVREVDAELFKRVALKNLKAKNIQDADHVFAVSPFLRGNRPHFCVDGRHQQVKHLAVHILTQCVSRSQSLLARHEHIRRGLTPDAKFAHAEHSLQGRGFNSQQRCGPLHVLPRPVSHLSHAGMTEGGNKKEWKR